MILARLDPAFARSPLCSLSVATCGVLLAGWIASVVLANAALLARVRLGDEEVLELPMLFPMLGMPLLCGLALADAGSRVPRGRLAREALLLLGISAVPAASGAAVGWLLEARGLVAPPDAGLIFAHPLAASLGGVGALLAVVARVALRPPVGEP